MVSVDIRKQGTKAISMTLLMLLCALAGCLGGETGEEVTDVTDPAKETLVIAYEVRDDYTNVDENPQSLADYLSGVLDYDRPTNGTVVGTHDFMDNSFQNCLTAVTISKIN